MKDELVYSLKMSFCPASSEEEKFLDILKFCEKAKIDDIQFFLNMEGVSRGHFSMKKTQVWMDMIGEWKEKLETEGMTVLLNAWDTAIHTGSQRTSNPRGKMILMVDPAGNRAEIVSGALDEKFHHYMNAVHAAVSEQCFNTIRIEDNYCLKCHEPLEWEGCFCELHRNGAHYVQQDVRLPEELQPYLYVVLPTLGIANKYTNVSDAINQLATVKFMAQKRERIVSM